MCWGDQGRVYFVIKKLDLVDSDFNNTWTSLQCGQAKVSKKGVKTNDYFTLLIIVSLGNMPVKI